ncbi:MAG: dipeptidase [Acidobacteriota bacterium]
MTPEIDRRRFLALSAAAAASFAGAPRLLARAGPSPAAAGWAGYERAIVVDALGGVGVDKENDDEPLTASDLSDARASGVTSVNITVSSVGVLEGAFEKTVRQIAYWERELARHPDVLMKVRSAADLRAAKAAGRLGLVYGFQDTLPLGDQVPRLDTFHGLGVRVIQLTYNRRNLAGDGCLEPGNAGLSRFGRELVLRMNALGILVDLSHCGQRTTAEGIAASAGPVAITHSGCAALADLPRNKTDEDLRALAEKGGVVGIYLMPFLRTKGQPMAEDVVRHIEHALQVCGEDHVGIGTDGSISPVAVTPEFVKRFREDIANRRRLGISAPGESEDVYTFVPDLNTPRRFETIASLLRARGHSDERVGKILGGNFARLFGEVWG